MESKTKKQQKPKWFKGEVYTKGATVENPFSGETYELNALELSIYDFIIGCQILFESHANVDLDQFVSQRRIDEFQKGLTWFRVNNPEAYYVLLDQQQFSFHEVNTDNRIQSEAVGKQRLQARTQKVRAFRGMKRILIITIALFASCSTQKRATPCRQCPQYSISEQQKLEYIKLNPFPHQIAYEKVDKVYFSVDK